MSNIRNIDGGGANVQEEGGVPIYKLVDDGGTLEDAVSVLKKNVDDKKAPFPENLSPREWVVNEMDGNGSGGARMCGQNEGESTENYERRVLDMYKGDYSSWQEVEDPDFRDPKHHE